MSIKTSISLFILMMGFSFNALANQVYYYMINPYIDSGVYQVSTNVQDLKDTFNGICIFGHDPRYPTSYFGTLNSSSHTSNSSAKYHKTIYADSGCTEYKKSLGSTYATIHNRSCPSGSSIDPVTGACQTDPVCEPPSVLDPDTLECITPPFCERESTNEAIFAAEQSCAAEGGIFSFECSDFLESLETRCTQSDECAIGFPNWPACMDDLDPTDDITPPSGGFDPSNPPTANPDGPSFDKPEPDEVLPTDTTDEAVLKAVQNANRDSNEGFKALSTDLNNGFTDTNNLLAQLNSTNHSIGESVVEQMNQDYQIHLANKQLALQQTGAINAGSASVVGALGSQTTNLTGALGEQTGALTGALGEQTDALTGAIGELADKLPENCEPTEANNFCENGHGLGHGFVGEAFDQMMTSGTAGLNSVENEALDYANSLISQPLTGNVEVVIEDQFNMVTNLFPDYSDCRPLEIPSPFGGVFVIPCDFSVKFKTIFSFIIYFYTMYAMADILLSGITPRAYTTKES